MNVAARSAVLAASIVLLLAASPPLPAAQRVWTGGGNPDERFSLGATAAKGLASEESAGARLSPAFSPMAARLAAPAAGWASRAPATA